MNRSILWQIYWISLFVEFAEFITEILDFFFCENTTKLKMMLSIVLTAVMIVEIHVREVVAIFW